MPIIKSAKKRVRVTKKATARNVKTKRNLRTAVKAFQAALKSKKPTSTGSIQSNYDKAVKKGVMHKNKAARKKRQLARAAKAAGVRPSTSTKKTVTSKKTATKTPSKKAAAKKSPIKKTVTKKK